MDICTVVGEWQRVRRFAYALGNALGNVWREALGCVVMVIL